MSQKQYLSVFMSVAMALEGLTHTTHTYETQKVSFKSFQHSELNYRRTYIELHTCTNTNCFIYMYTQRVCVCVCLCVCALHIQSCRSVILPMATRHHFKTFHSKSVFIQPPANGPFVRPRVEITLRTHTLGNLGRSA